MKNTFYALAAFATSAVAAPTSTLFSKRQQADGPVGYASQNGGSSYAEFTEAVAIEEPMIVYVKGKISQEGEQARPSSDTSIIGLDSSSGIDGFGLYIKEVSNVIVQNIAVSNVQADNGDGIAIQEATNVWVDHCDLSSNMDHDKDYYDGLLDVTHAADYVTVSNCFIHDHWKASLVGHSDSNGDEDTGFLHVTYANNYWLNVNSRAPSVRFGTAHIFNNYYENMGTGAVNTCMGAEVLIESTQFVDVAKPVYSEDSDTEGSATLNDVDLGSGANSAPAGSMTVDYKYALLGADAVKAAVVGTAGNTLTLG